MDCGTCGPLYLELRRNSMLLVDAGQVIKPSWWLCAHRPLLLDLVRLSQTMWLLLMPVCTPLSMRYKCFWCLLRWFLEPCLSVRASNSFCARLSPPSLYLVCGLSSVLCLHTLQGSCSQGVVLGSLSYKDPGVAFSSAGEKKKKNWEYTRQALCSFPYSS